MPDQFATMLTDIAKAAEEAGPMRASSLIRRRGDQRRTHRRAAVGVLSAVAVGAIVATGSFVGMHRTANNLPATSPSVTARPTATADPTATASPSASLSPAPPARPTSAVPVVGSIAGLPGWLYYTDGDRLLRLNTAGPTTVLAAGAYTATVSPDGTRMAFIDQNTNVVVADRNGKNGRTVLRGSVGAGYEPAWSPDSQRLLSAKNAGGGKVTLGIVAVATGDFSPLAHQPQDVIHPLWSADGQHLGYATGACRIGTADSDGANARTVPVFGDRNTAVNPQQRRNCDPYSISPDGTLIAVDQHTGDQTDGDIGRNPQANTVIDTRTGNNIALPVTGTITAILFQPNGDILVRTTNNGSNQLILLNPDRTVKAQVTEPAAVTNAHLLAYTPN